MVNQIKTWTRAAGAAAVLISALAAASSAGAAVIYNVNQGIGLGSVIGTIETDGTTGTLGETNFLTWNLSLNGVGASFGLDQGNSVVRVLGSAVSATPTQLLFNFGAPSESYLLFQNNLFSGTHYYCAASVSGTCYQGQTVTPEHISNPSAQVQAMSGEQVIGTVGVVPEPGVWSMMILGLGSLGAALRRRRREGFVQV
jgi:hypothetical protein